MTEPSTAEALRLVPCRKAALPTDASGVLREFGEAMAGLYEQVGEVPPWIGYFALRGETMVGGGAFVGPPADGRVEIAYFTLPEFEGQGCATAVARHLVRLASATEPTVTIFAKTMPEENASTAVLTRLGFAQDGITIDHEIGEAWAWILMPPAA